MKVRKYRTHKLRANDIFRKWGSRLLITGILVSTVPSVLNGKPNSAVEEVNKEELLRRFDMPSSRGIWFLAQPQQVKNITYLEIIVEQRLKGSKLEYEHKRLIFEVMRELCKKYTLNEGKYPEKREVKNVIRHIAYGAEIEEGKLSDLYKEKIEETRKIIIEARDDKELNEKLKTAGGVVIAIIILLTLLIKSGDRRKPIGKPGAGTILRPPRERYPSDMS